MKESVVEFKEFEKIPRLNRPVVITEKIDGTNACVIVMDAPTFEERQVFAQSRNRVITPEKDNFGFAKWVEANKECLKQLGPGYHYGEWWGNGIQRGYGMTDKCFSLFNVYRWHLKGETPPACCSVVPVLRSQAYLPEVPVVVEELKSNGSKATPGFMDPEGVIVWHDGAQRYFKVTCKNDEQRKGNAA